MDRLSYEDLRQAEELRDTARQLGGEWVTPKIVGDMLVAAIAEIREWRALYGRLGGDDWTAREATADDVCSLVQANEEHSRAALAYKLAKVLGIDRQVDLDRLSKAEDHRKVVDEVLARAAVLTKKKKKPVDFEEL